MVSFLDLARWVSAVMVMLGHGRNPLFLGYENVPVADRNILVQAWYFVSGWHAEAVIVFFVLSGFLVGGAGLGRHVTGSFSARGYFIDRVTRLYVAFLPAVFVGFGLDLVGVNWLAGSGLWDGSQAMIAEKINAAPFETLMSIQHLLATLAMVPQSYIEPVGSNQPLWTISLEFWFYVVFGLTLLIGIARSATARIVALAALAGAFIFLGPHFLLFLGLWLLGIVAAFFPKQGRLVALISGLVFLAILAYIRLNEATFSGGIAPLFIRYYLVAASFALFLASMRSVHSRLLVALAPLNAFLASFSYSLYLLHFPLLFFIYGLLFTLGFADGLATGYSPASLEGLTIHIGALAFAMVFAWAFAQATEQRTPAVRRWMKQRLGIR